MIVSLVNQKGGVGKSTTAWMLATGLTQAGKKTLSVDIDPQCSLSNLYKAKTDSNTVFTALTGSCTARDAITHTDSGDIIPASKALAKLDSVFQGDADIYFKLKDIIDAVSDGYDYVIIDCPPALGTLSINALIASDRVILPLQTDIMSLDGLKEFASTYLSIKKRSNTKLAIDGIVFCRYDARAVRFNEDIIKHAGSMAEQLNTRIYSTRIRESIDVKRAQALKQTIYEYAPTGKVTADCKSFIDEFMKGSTQ